MQTQRSAGRKLAAVVVAAATCGAMGLGAVPANAVAPSELAMARLAAPTKIGPVTGLTATVTKPSASYRVSAVWNALSAATSYEVVMKNAATGVVVAKSKVTQASWSADTALAAGTGLTVTVTPFAAKRRGKPATTSATLPDLTAPVGRYTVTVSGTVATVTQDSLTDDVSAADRITREIDWDKGDGYQAWTSGTSLTQDYPELHVWHPKVRLTDQAGNATVVALQAVVIGDETAPTGTYTAAPLSAWAKLTPVVLTEVDIWDNLSADGDIKRYVNWKDGSPEVEWATGTTLSHVYAGGGSYTPSVRLVDEANHETIVDSSAVAVAVDAVAPKVAVKVPTRRATSVRSWKTVRGTASDGTGTGVGLVYVRVVEKRRGAWYAYRATTRTWVRAGATKAAALRKTRAVRSVPSSTGAWSASIAGLRKGTLALSVFAADRVGNTSRPVAVSKKLTRR